MDLTANNSAQIKVLREAVKFALAKTSSELMGDDINNKQFLSRAEKGLTEARFALN